MNHSDFAQLLFPKAAPVRLCGIGSFVYFYRLPTVTCGFAAVLTGDHLTATFDAVLMVQRSLELVLGDLQIQRHLDCNVGMSLLV